MYTQLSLLPYVMFRVDFNHCRKNVLTVAQRKNQSRMENGSNQPVMENGSTAGPLTLGMEEKDVVPVLWKEDPSDKRLVQSQLICHYFVDI